MTYQFVMITLTAIISFASCSKPEMYELSAIQHQQLSELKYILKEKVTVSTTSTFNKRNSTRIIENELYFLDNDEKNLLKFNIEKKKIDTICSYSSFSKNPYDFFHNSKGTYFLFTNPSNLVLIDNNNEIKSIGSQSDGVVFLTYPFMNDRLKIEENGDFTCAAFNTSYDTLNKYTYKKLNTNNSLYYYFHESPSVLNRLSFPLTNSASFMNLEDQNIVSYGFSHKISIYNKDSLVDEKITKSNFLKNVRGLPLNSSFQEESNYIIEEGFYLGIYYNKFENRFYRIVKHKQDLKEKDGKLKERYNGNWSIICFDRDFNPIGEALMPPNKYHYYACFTNDQPGLWVSKHSDSMVFERMEFIKI